MSTHQRPRTPTSGARRRETREVRTIRSSTPAAIMRPAASTITVISSSPPMTATGKPPKNRLDAMRQTAASCLDVINLSARNGCTAPSLSITRGRRVFGPQGVPRWCALHSPHLVDPPGSPGEAHAGSQLTPWRDASALDAERQFWRAPAGGPSAYSSPGSRGRRRPELISFSRSGV